MAEFFTTFQMSASESCFESPQSWTVATATVLTLYHKQQNVLANFFISSSVSNRTFCDHSIYKDPISKMFHNFSLELNMAKRRHDFLSQLWVRKLGNYGLQLSKGDSDALI